MVFNVFLKCAQQWVLTSITLLVFTISPAKAEVVEIELEYSPDARGSGSQIVIKPSKAKCHSSLGSMCNNGGVSSRNVFYTGLGFEERYVAGVTSGFVRFSVPSSSRKISLTEVGGTHTENLEFHITGMGGVLGSTASIAGDWDTDIAPCSSVARATTGGGGRSFFWDFTSGSKCEAYIPLGRVNLRYALFSYRFSSGFKKPLMIKPGIYKGTLSYRVSSGNSGGIGIGMGRGVTSVEDEVLVINFTLTVAPVLRVDIPADGNKVNLSPVEGWQTWLQRGRKPTKLSKDQTFNIWTTSPFTMKLECANQTQGKCALKKSGSSPHLVPVDVCVSLPSNFVDSSSSRVARKPLTARLANAEIFTPTQLLERTPATLHFEVQKESVSEMLDYPGSQYGGTITVVWETTI